MTAPIALGPFELIAPAEAGGMGQVWQARHAQQNFPVALKVFSYPNPSDEILAAFRNEARAVAQLNHPHIVRLFDYGEITPEAHDLSEGALPLSSPYLVMEHLSGGILEAGSSFTSWCEIESLLMTLMRALGHAHARGVLHRDLKPGNILFGTSSDWRPGLKLIDFGLARDRDAGGLLGPGLVAGTPGFAAPEQFNRARAFEQGPWTDLFSLGCIAFYVVTQKLPFVGEDLQASIAACKAGAREVFEPGFELPTGFEGWLDNLLGYDPSSRYQCAADALHAFEELNSNSKKVSVDLGEGWKETEQEDSIPLEGDIGIELFGLRRPPLTKRADERQFIWQALADVAQSNQPRAVILSGDAGTGKSRLAQWMVERADEVGAAKVLRANHSRTHGLHEGLAGMFARHFGCMGLAWSQVLVRLQSTLFQGRETPMRDVITTAELIRPALSVSKRKKERQRHFDSPQERYEAMRQCLIQLASLRPLVLWLDDVQWGRDTLEFVRYLLEHGDEKLPVLCLLTIRDDGFQETNQAYAPYHSLLKANDVSNLRLSPLSDDDLDAILGGMLALSMDVASQVKTRAKGNPLFALQLVGDWIERKLLRFDGKSYALQPDGTTGIPDNIHEVWMNRVETLLTTMTHGQVEKVARKLRTQASHALELAACLGQEVDDAEWAGLCASQKIDVAQLLVDRLLRSGLASRTECGWRFEHPLLRESLERESEDFGQRGYHHQQCAEFLEAHLDQTDFGSLARVGSHYMRAGYFDEAQQRLLEAARLAVDSGEFNSADESLAMRGEALDAMHSGPSDALRVEGWLGKINRLCTQNQDLDEALLLARQVVEAARENKEIRQEGLGLFYQGVVADHEGDHVAAHEHYQTSFGLLEKSGTNRELALAYYVRARSKYYLGELKEARVLCTEATERYRALDDDFGAARCSDVMAKVYRADGDFQKAEQVTEAARADFEKLGYRDWEALAWTTLGEIKRLSDKLDEADACYDESIALWDEIGSQKVFYPRLNQAYVLLKRREFEDAKVRFQGLMEIAESWGLGWTLPGLHLGLLGCAAGIQDWRGFDEHIAAASILLGEQGSALDEYAQLYEFAGDLAGEEDQPKRQKQAYLLAAAQWAIMNYDKRAKEVELKFPTGV